MNSKEDNQTTNLKGTTLIDAQQLEVWEVVKHIEKISSFHPLIKSSHRMNEIQGVGAKRHCDLYPMGAMDEQIIEWDEGVGFTASVVGGKMLPPCKFMVGSLKLEREESRTRATFTFSYQMKFGIFGRIMNLLFIKPQFRRAPIKYVEGLKVFMENP